MKRAFSFLAVPALCLAQVVTVDSSGNITAQGSYSSGSGGAAAGTLSLKGSTSGTFGIAVGATPTTHTWLIPNTSTPTTGQIPILTAPDGSNNVAVTYGSVLGTANQVTVTAAASSITISLPSNSVATTIGSQAANLVYASPNGSSGTMGPRALVKADQVGTTVYTDQSNTFSTGTQDFTSATAVKVPVSGGAAPTANGAIAYDSTQRKYTVGENNGNTQQTVNLVRTVSTQIGSSDTLTCSTIGTTETAFATQYQIPANFFIANKTLEVYGVFEGKFDGLTAMNLSARLHATGNVKFIQLVSATPTSSGGQQRGGGFVFLLQGTGAPGSSATLETGILSEALALGSTSNLIAQPVTVDTTQAETFQLTLTCAAAGAANANTVTLRQLHVREVN